MKLCAIYNVWDDYDLLELSIENIKSLVQGVIIITSTKSNYGEVSELPDFIKWTNQPSLNISVYVREPQFSHPMNSETDKRNFGLNKARELGYTHFIMMDADEFYHPEDFLKEKQRFIDNPDLQGLVSPTRVYFKSPTLTIGLDTTLVPFIHKITPTLKHEFNRRYPFAWQGHNIKIDPTRSLNIDSGVEMCDIVMEHMSYVRRDLRKKVRNSTAKANIEKSSLFQDYKNAKEGVYCEFYKKTLISVPNYFNIPEIIDLSV